MVAKIEATNAHPLESQPRSLLDKLTGTSRLKRKTYQPTGMDMLKSATAPLKNAYQGYKDAFAKAESSPKGKLARKKIYYESGS